MANVSHALKTPVSLVRLYAEMLLNQYVASEEDRRDCYRTIVREAERLSLTVENVLHLSRLNKGQPAFRRDPFRFTARRPISCVAAGAPAWAWRWPNKSPRPMAGG